MNTSNYHNCKQAAGCGCHACRQRASEMSGELPHWRMRRQRRLGNATPPAQSQGEWEGETAGQHQYFRQRKILRHQPRYSLPSYSPDEVLNETPIFHIISKKNSPVQMVPALHRKFDGWRPEQENQVSTIPKVRIVYVYFGNKERERMITYWRNQLQTPAVKLRQDLISRIGRIINGIQNCQRPNHWRQSEKDVLQAYRSYVNRFAKGQALIYKNKLRSLSRGIPKGSSIPDVMLPYQAKSMQGMQLPSRKEFEMELIDVKNYWVGNPNLVSNVADQVKKRQRINIGGNKQGLYQSIVLDFRGQESRCAEIRGKAREVARAAHAKAPDVSLLIQVLLWKGCPNPNQHCEVKSENIF